MKTETTASDDRADGQRSPARKRAYRAPEIRRLGSVQELTLSGGATSQTDALGSASKAGTSAP
jgi:hypothetical protein